MFDWDLIYSNFTGDMCNIKKSSLFVESLKFCVIKKK